MLTRVGEREKTTFLKWIGKALKEGSIHIPEENGSITWKLPRTFLELPHWRPQRNASCHRIEALCKKTKKEGFMQIVLKAWSSNPDYSAGCDYAVVEGGEAFLKLALRRINVLREQKVLDPSL